MAASLFHAAPIAAAPARPGFSARVVAFLDTLVKSVQWARMTRALSDMSDAQLAQIGVARADIPAHAQKLVFGE